jgi:glycogen(starch) synthase
VHAVYAARFAPRKRVLPLLEALRQTRELLGERAGELYVTIAGEGEELGKARAFLEANEMTGWVSLPGRLSREQLKELYRRADVYLAPGVLDAFSVASQEAQAAGLAIVSRSQSGAAELVTEGVEGLLADDDEAFAAQLARLVREPELLERIVTRNRTVPPLTAWDAVVAAHDEVYALAEQRYAP